MCNVNQDRERNGLATARDNKSRGVAALWVAITGFVMIGFVGVAMDLSHIKLTANQLQNAADAAALAGAMKVRASVDEARTLAVLTASANNAANDSVQLNRNDGNTVDGDIVVGFYDRNAKTFDSTASSPNAVKVIARRTSSSLNGSLPLYFGPIVGVSTAEVARTAIAMVGGSTGAGMIVLDPQESCSLQLNGNNDLILESAPGYDGDAAIQVNSGDPCAMCTSGSSLTIEAPETNIVGDICTNGNPTLNTDIHTGTSEIPDPLAGLPAPSWGPPDLGGIFTGGTYPSGYYSQGIRITSNADTVVLESGIYVVDGEGLYINGGNLIAHDVMFYIIGTGRLYLGGNGIIEISPSSNTGNPYWGMSIFQARDNTNPSTIIGTSNMDLEGTLYFPKAPLEIGGDGIALGNQLVAWKVWIHGTGTFTVQYDGRNPAPGSKVFLVQ